MSQTVPTRAPSPGPTEPLRGPGPSSILSGLRPPEAEGEIGRLGGYRVLRLLAEGGMGKVFLAEDLTLHRSVALKVVHPDLERTLPGAGERFLREGRAMAAIDHPNLVRVYAAGEDGGTVFLAMELLRGETLEARLARSAPLPPDQVIKVGRGVAAGLSAIHAAGLIHRDIKPANLWLEEVRGAKPGPNAPVRVKILDFGLVRGGGGEAGLTEVGMIVGTPAYLSPEQVQGTEFDHRADLFSLGCVLYRACTNRLPFAAETGMAMLIALARDEAVPVATVNPAVPPALAALVMRLLEKDPARRPASAAEVANRLGQIGRDLAGPAPTDPMTRPTPVPPKPVPPKAVKTEPLTVPKAAPLRAVKAEPARAKATKRKRPAAAKRPWWVWPAVATATLAVATLLAVAVLRTPTRPPVDDSRPPDTVAAPPGKPVALPAPAPKAEVVYLTGREKVASVSWPFQPPPMGKGPPPEDGGPPGGPPRLPPPTGPFVVRGQVVQHGLFMHPAPPREPPASVTFRLDGAFARLTGAAAFVDQAPPDAPPATFVISDGTKELWRRTVQRDGPEVRFDVPVAGLAAVKLEVRADEPRGCHAVWVDPTLTAK